LKKESAQLRLRLAVVISVTLRCESVDLEDVSQGGETARSHDTATVHQV
jgi:hypothetical protein